MRRDPSSRARSALPRRDRLASLLRSAARPRERLLAIAIALLAGLIVFRIAADVFPYHSINHDEGVYLQQATMLLSGQFNLYPGELGDAVRPWFFVDAGDRFYPKYQPLPAALYAVSMALFDEPRVTLAIVAAGNAALAYMIGSAAFDRRVGVLASALFAAAPLTLVTSSVFLPYATTAFFNLAFAACYLRSRRTGDVATAALAGVAIGLAFFARPYTAVLFAAPFVLHALWELASAIRTEGLRSNRFEGPPLLASFRSLPNPVRRQAATAVAGLAFVAATLAYNAAVTGSPLRFPYEAFAPHDGPGFGHREILDHSLEYTPAVAVEANGYVLWYLLTRWGPAGLLGTALAAVGLFASARRWSSLTADGSAGAAADATRSGVADTARPDGDGVPRALLAGLFVSVPLGNLAFWGNYNILGRASDPTDGLIGHFGPFYHFDLLAPLAIFAAAGAVACWRRARPAVERARRESSRGALRSPAARRALLLSAALVGLLVLGGVNAALVSGPLDRNAAQTAAHEEAYEPFEERDLENAVVFLPTPYGDWLNHPYQYLRNDPGFDGEVVYVTERDAAGDFAVIDAYPDREYYRYTHHGEWTPFADEREVEPRLEALSIRSGDRLAGETTVGVPDRVDHATVRIETGSGEYAAHAIADPGEEIAVDWTVEGDGTVAVESIDGDSVDTESIAVDGADEVVVTVRLVQPEGGTLTYRQAVPVRTTDDGVEAVWPPERTVCLLADECGLEGTYFPDRADEYPDGVAFETDLVGERESE